MAILYWIAAIFGSGFLLSQVDIILETYMKCLIDFMMSSCWSMESTIALAKALQVTPKQCIQRLISRTNFFAAI